MSGSCQVNGARVTHAKVTIPIYGCWVADLELEGATVLTGLQTLQIGNLSLAGTVVRQNVFAGTNRARLVAGYGGWRMQVPPRGYSNPLGVKMSTVIADAASAAGEKVNVPVDRTIGNFYARSNHKASRVLKLLASDIWYVDPTGVTQVQDRVSTAISSPFSVNKWDGGKGQFEISTEVYEDWVPGRTFTTSTVPTPITISSVTIDADNDGKVRLTVTTADTQREQLLAEFRSIVRSETQSLIYSGIWEYVIAPNPLAPGLVFTVDATPTDSRLPPLTNVPLANGIGRLSPPVTGAKARIRFVNQDPTRPEVMSFDGQTEHLMTVEAFTVVMHNMLFAMGSAGLPAAWLASNIIPGIINLALSGAAAGGGPGVIAQTVAAASMASSMTSGPGSSSTLYTAAIAAAAAAKLPDVTGLFPSVGVV